MGADRRVEREGRNSLKPTAAPSVVVYDASCVLCSRSANFVAKRDIRGRFVYADLSSPRAHAMLRERGLNPDDLDVVALIEGERAYTGSTAALKIIALLPFPWSLMKVFLLVPRFLREPPYRFTARNRHRLLGGRSCPTPHPRLRDRLLS